jgi:hypothetical protein
MRGGDFSARTGAVGRFSRSVLSRRAILTTGVRRESRKPHPTERGVSPTALCGRRAEIAGNDLPVAAVQGSDGQMQHDAAHRRLHVESGLWFWANVVKRNVYIWATNASQKHS